MGKEEKQFDELTPDVKSNGYRVVGTRPIRPDGMEKVTGKATFGADYDLPGMLTGCVVPSPVVETGSQYGRDRVRLGLVGGAQLLLRRAGSAWRIVAATRPGWNIDYSEWPGTFPGAVRLRSTPAGGTDGAIDLTVRPAQISANGALGSDVFSVDVPVSARLLTVDDLRGAGPLLGPE